VQRTVEHDVGRAGAEVAPEIARQRVVARSLARLARAILFAGFLDPLDVHIRIGETCITDDCADIGIQQRRVLLARGHAPLDTSKFFRACLEEEAFDRITIEKMPGEEGARIRLVDLADTEDGVIGPAQLPQPALRRHHHPRKGDENGLLLRRGQARELIQCITPDAACPRIIHRGTGQPRFRWRGEFGAIPLIATHQDHDHQRPRENDQEESDHLRAGSVARQPRIHHL